MAEIEVEFTLGSLALSSSSYWMKSVCPSVTSVQVCVSFTSITCVAVFIVYLTPVRQGRLSTYCKWVDKGIMQSCNVSEYRCILQGAVVVILCPSVGLSVGHMRTSIFVPCAGSQWLLLHHSPQLWHTLKSYFSCSGEGGRMLSLGLITLRIIDTVLTPLHEPCYNHVLQCVYNYNDIHLNVMHSCMPSCFSCV